MLTVGFPRNVSTPPMGTLQNSGARDRRRGASMSKATALNGWSSCANETVLQCKTDHRGRGEMIDCCFANGFWISFQPA